MIRKRSRKLPSQFCLPFLLLILLLRRSLLRSWEVTQPEMPPSSLPLRKIYATRTSTSVKRLHLAALPPTKYDGEFLSNDASPTSLLVSPVLLSRPLLFATFSSPLTRPHPSAQCIIKTEILPVATKVCSSLLSIWLVKRFTNSEGPKIVFSADTRHSKVLYIVFGAYENMQKAVFSLYSIVFINSFVFLLVDLNLFSLFQNLVFDSYTINCFSPSITTALTRPPSYSTRTRLLPMTARMTPRTLSMSRGWALFRRSCQACFRPNAFVGKVTWNTHCIFSSTITTLGPMLMLIPSPVLCTSTRTSPTLINSSSSFASSTAPRSLRKKAALILLNGTDVKGKSRPSLWKYLFSFFFQKNYVRVSLTAGGILMYYRQGSRQLVPDCISSNLQECQRWRQVRHDLLFRGLRGGVLFFLAQWSCCVLKYWRNRGFFSFSHSSSCKRGFL